MPRKHGLFGNHLLPRKRGTTNQGTFYRSVKLTKARIKSTNAMSSLFLYRFIQLGDFRLDLEEGVPVDGRLDAFKKQFYLISSLKSVLVILGIDPPTPFGSGRNCRLINFKYGNK